MLRKKSRITQISPSRHNMCARAVRYMSHLSNVTYSRCCRSYNWLLGLPGMI